MEKCEEDAISPDEINVTVAFPSAVTDGKEDETVTEQTDCGNKGLPPATEHATNNGMEVEEQQEEEVLPVPNAISESPRVKTSPPPTAASSRKKSRKQKNKASRKN